MNYLFIDSLLKGSENSRIFASKNITGIQKVSVLNYIEFLDFEYENVGLFVLTIINGQAFNKVGTRAQFIDP